MSPVFTLHPQGESMRLSVTFLHLRPIIGLLLCCLSILLGQYAQANTGSMAPDIHPQIDWVPEGKPAWHPGWMNGYVRGLELVLKWKGHAVDYTTMMGDSGQAFIMQGEENSTNLVNGAVDVGWWPLEPLGLIRLNFLEQTVGRQIRDAKIPAGETKGDLFNTWFKPKIVTSLQQQNPCVAIRLGDADYIITGCDDAEHPLLGMCTNTKAGEERVDRLEEPLPPYALLTIGKALSKIDRKQADREALKFAVALHSDQVLNQVTSYSGKYGLRRYDEYKTHWRTGTAAFNAWITVLQDNTHIAPHYAHANVAGFLARNRQSAVQYLKDMRQRHSGQFTTHLDTAITKYDAVVAEVQKADLRNETHQTPEGRGKLITLIQGISLLEDEAVNALELALKASE